jgi:hypothetical protein
MDLDYQIHYKKGITNVTRRVQQEEEVVAVSECLPTWIKKLRDGYTEHAENRQLLTKLSLNGNDQKGFELVDGVIRFKG